jgi:hypothetical protein
MINRRSHPISPPPFQSQPDEPAQTPEPAPVDHSGRRIWHAWLRLTGPRSQAFGASTAAQERLRRSRLISVLLILVAVVILLLVPSALKIPGLWQAIIIMGALGVLAALLNRACRVTLSGLTVIALADVSITENIVRQPHGLTNTTVADLYLLAIAVMVAGMVLPNIFIPLVGAVQVIICIAVFVLLHHDTLLTQEIQQIDGNMAYTSVLGPILLQVCSVGIVWLYSWSVDRAILRASRAEELAEARSRLNQVVRQLAEQKKRLEHGIETMQDALARFANGDYSVRTSLQDNELLPLAVSFNIMAERLSRVQKVEESHRRMESALQRLFDACTAIARGAAPTALEATNTLADRIFPFLARLHALMVETVQIGGLVDDLRSVLQRQHEYLTQVETQLTSGLTLTKSAKEQSTALSRQSESGSGPLGARSPDFRKTLMNLHIVHTQQISLLEQVGKSSAQAHELCLRCIHGTRILGQRLKEAG